MPKVSVNIPCFNSASFIRGTIDSVLAQTYTDFEIVVMDDGSSDNTGQIIRSYSDPRIKYFYKTNEGLSETRNKGIRQSRGDYIAFLDHDDIWLPEKLTKQVAVLERNKEIGLVFSDSYISKGGQRQKMTYFDRSNPKRGLVFEDLLFQASNFIPVSTVVMRRVVFEEAGYFKKEFRIGEEYELFLRVADRCKFDYVEEPLAEYRVHKGNFSNRKDLAVKEMSDILEFWKTVKPELYRRRKGSFLQKEAALLYELANFYALDYRRKDALENFDLSLSKYRSKSVLVKRCILAILGPTGYRLSSALFNKVRYGI